MNACAATRSCPKRPSWRRWPPATCVPSSALPPHTALRPCTHVVLAASPVDSILDKESYSLEELLDEDELIQECKSLNARLTAYLKQKDTVEKLVRAQLAAADAVAGGDGMGLKAPAPQQHRSGWVPHGDPRAALPPHCRQLYSVASSPARKSTDNFTVPGMTLREFG